MTIDSTQEFDPLTDTRNIADEFKGMSVDAIRLAVQKIRTPMVNIAMNLTSDFNKSSVLRAHNAHAGREFVLVNRVNEQDPSNTEGIKKWDKRGAVGTAHYETLKYVTDWETLFEGYRAEGYTIYAVDNNVDFGEPVAIYNEVFPEKTAFVYGEEGLGLSPEMIRACDAMVYIPQFGTVRSLNISQAAAVCMYEYSRQHRPQL